MSRRSCSSLFAAAVLLALAIAPPVAARDGAVDSGFGSGGAVVADFAPGAGGEGGGSVLLLPGGRIFVGGPGQGNGFGLDLYRRDGSLDPAFAGGGQVYYQLSPGPNPTSTPADFARGPAGTILSGGFAYEGSDPFDGLVARFTPSGGLDTSFGNDPPRPPGDGLVRLDFGTSNLLVSGIEPAPGGGAYIVGRTGTNMLGGANDILVGKLRADGSLDPSFGSGGLIIANPGVNDQGEDVAVQQDGKIVVAGTTDANLILLRYRPNGTLDPSFGGGDGAATVPGLGIGVESNARIVLLKDGRILVGLNDGEAIFMTFNSQMAVARFRSSGKLDQSFGSSGIAETPVGENTYFAGIAVADDGRIVLTGSTRSGTERTATILGLRASGKADRRFGTAGVVSYGQPGILDFAGDVAVQPDRRIVVTGETYDGTSDNRITFRLLGDTIPPDTAFGRHQGGAVSPGGIGVRFHVRRDVHARYQCSLVVGAGVARPAPPGFHGCHSPLRLRARPHHTYLIRVRAIDRAGNVDPTPAKLRLTVR